MPPRKTDGFSGYTVHATQPERVKNLHVQRFIWCHISDTNRIEIFSNYQGRHDIVVLID